MNIFDLFWKFLTSFARFVPERAVENKNARRNTGGRELSFAYLTLQLISASLHGPK